MNKTLSAILLISIAGSIHLHAAESQAAELRWSNEPYAYYADQEPLRELLNNLMSTQGVPVVVSKQVDDVVSARFEPKPPREIFQQLVKTYNFTWYYDGQVLYVYSNDEVQTATIKLDSLSVKDFSHSLRRLGVLDERFSWNTSEPDGLVYFSGPQRFVSLVMEMAEVMDKQSHQEKVYKWRGEDGTMNFSSTPPPESPQQGVEVVRLLSRHYVDQSTQHNATTNEINAASGRLTPSTLPGSKRPGEQHNKQRETAE